MNMKKMNLQEKRIVRMTKKNPMRMCVGCHEMREKRDLIRVLKMQDNTFCIDPAAVHICAKIRTAWNWQ